MHFTCVQFINYLVIKTIDGKQISYRLFPLLQRMHFLFVVGIMESSIYCFSLFRLNEINHSCSMIYIQHFFLAKQIALLIVFVP